MSSELTQAPQTGLATADLVEKARGYAKASKASATLKAYATQRAAFAAWCASRGLSALPAEPATVALYLTDRAQQRPAVSTLAQALCAISRQHAEAGLPNPRQSAQLRAVWEGIQRDLGTAQKQARALPTDQLRRMSKGSTSRGLGGARDRAVMLLGFAMGCRRAELVALDVADLREEPDGLAVTIRRSKTDQRGEGRTVGVPYGSEPSTCPVRAVRAWLEASGITSGALFRGVRYGRLTEHRLDGGSVARLLKRAAKRSRVPTASLSGHSLRAGLVTAAAKAGKSAGAIQAQTGHKTAAMIMRYYRAATLFDDNAAAGIGL